MAEVLTRAEAHTCHAKCCTKKVPPAMFMCRSHWYMLPWQYRAEILTTYVRGQEDRMDPSPEYLEVAQEAIDWLAHREGVVAACR